VAIDSCYFVHIDLKGESSLLLFDDVFPGWSGRIDKITVNGTPSGRCSICCGSLGLFHAKCTFDSCLCNSYVLASGSKKNMVFLFGQVQLQWL